MGFSLPQLSSCCCGCTIRTGTLIILWLYVVGSILLLSSPLLVSVQISNSTISNSTNTGSSTDSKPTPSPVTVIVPVLDLFSVICTTINVIVGIIALFGVYKELHLYLTPFLAWKAFYTILALKVFIIAFTMGIVLYELINFLIAIYFWLVVFSHYRVLKGSVRPIQA